MGERNYRWFLAFLYLNALLMAYGVWAALAVLLHDIESLKLLTVRYYLYLALHDEQRAYFKTQEIQLWRKKEASASPFSSS